MWDSQRDWAASAIPFWARAQKANASMGGAYADVLKRQKGPAKAPPKSEPPSKAAPKK